MIPRAIKPLLKTKSKSRLFFSGIEYNVVDVEIPGRRNPLPEIVNITVPLIDYAVSLRLRASSKILDPNFVLLIRDDNSTKLLTKENSGNFPCFYRSHQEELRAALDLCGGVVSFIAKSNPLFGPYLWLTALCFLLFRGI